MFERNLLSTRSHKIPLCRLTKLLPPLAKALKLQWKKREREKETHLHQHRVNEKVECDLSFHHHDLVAAVSGALFKHQLHRNELQAVKPIGAGQFGQVQAVLSADQRDFIRCSWVSSRAKWSLLKLSGTLFQMQTKVRV